MPKGKILFIDDDSFLRKVYQSELKDKGFDVHLAVDGVDGLQKVAQIRPDLILLDLIMPKKSGFEVLAELQRFGETRSIPVIVLSNLAQSDDQKRVFDLGAVEYLIKDNATLDIITAKIEAHLNQARAQNHTAPAGSDTDASPSLSSALLQEKEEIKTADKPVEKAATPAPKPASKRGHNFCPTCGFKTTKKNKFCPDCGTTL